MPGCIDRHPFLRPNQDQTPPPAVLIPPQVADTLEESEARRRPRSWTKTFRYPQNPEIPDIEDLVPAPRRSAAEAEHPHSRPRRQVVAELPFGRQVRVQSVVEAEHPASRSQTVITQQIGEWVRVIRRPGPAPEGEDVVGRFATHADMYEEAPGSTGNLPIQALRASELSPAPANIKTHFELMNYLSRHPKEVIYPHFHPKPDTKNLKDINIQPFKEVLRISRLPGGPLYTQHRHSPAYVRPDPLVEFSKGIDRLRSFKGWRWWTAMPSRLAFAGFVYRGNGDEIECFCCRLKIENFYSVPYDCNGNWEPVLLHLNRARVYCSHLDNILGDKKTLVEGHWFDKNIVASNFRHSQHSLVIFGNGGPLHKNLADLAPRLLKYYSYKYDPIIRGYHWSSQAAKTLAKQGFFSKQKYPTTAQMAEAGFFAESETRVCCYHCGMSVEMWPVHLEDSSPTTVHDLYFPQCFLSQIRNLPAPKPLQFVSKPVPEDGELMDQDEEDERERSDQSRPECKLCLQNEGNILSITCGHVLGCADCVQRIKNLQCPFCRTGINAIMTIYT